MLKVLVVDDEPMIRKGLTTIIDWNHYGFEVCGEASNGQEGMKKIQELEPHLVIADIKMPGMGGLEMIEELKKLGIQCKVIILSGYSEFLYAQKAVELGVESYLLKPIDQDKLVEKVEEIHSEIVDSSKMKECFEQGLRVSRDRMLGRLMEGQLDEEIVCNANEQYGWGFPWKSYQVLLVEIEDERVGYRLMKDKTREKVEHFVRNEEYGFSFLHPKGLGILLRNKNYTSKSLAVKNIYRFLQDTVQSEITLALGTVVSNIQHIPDGYRHAQDILKRKFVYEHGGILAVSHEETLMPLDHSNKEELIDKLYMAVDVNHLTKVKSLLEDFQAILIQEGHAEQDIKAMYTNLYTALINKIVFQNPELSEIVKIEEIVFAEINRMPRLRALHEYILYKLMAISQELVEIRPEGLMKKILDYISRNYHTQIKLATLAEVFSYNGAYLGKLFKSYTGESFNTYLDRVRIEKAKQLLQDGYKVKNTAERVGYKDINYFYNKFRKHTRTSPSAFRTSK